MDIPGNTVNYSQNPIDSNNRDSGESDSSAVKPDDECQAKVLQLPALNDKDASSVKPDDDEFEAKLLQLPVVTDKDASAVKPDDDECQAKVLQLPVLTDKDAVQVVPIVQHEDMEVGLMEDGSETVESIQNATEMPTEELMTVPINSPLGETLSSSVVEHEMEENFESLSESRKEDGITDMEIAEEISHVPNVNSAEEEREVLKELPTAEKDREFAGQEIICSKEIESDEQFTYDKELSSGKEHISSADLVNEQEVNTISGACAESLIESDNFICDDKMDTGVDFLTVEPSVGMENDGLDANRQAIDMEAVEVLPELNTYSAQNSGDKATESFKEYEENSECNGPDENRQAIDMEAVEVLPELNTCSVENTEDKGAESFQECEEHVENNVPDENRQAMDVEVAEVLPERNTCSVENTEDKGTESFPGQECKEHFENAATDHMENDSTKPCIAEKLPGDASSPQTEGTLAEKLEARVPCDIKQIPSDENRQAIDMEAGEVLPELNTCFVQNTGDKGTESLKTCEENSENAATEHMENDSTKPCIAEKLPGEATSPQTEGTSAENLDSRVPCDIKQISSSPRDKPVENASSCMENVSCDSSAEKVSLNSNCVF